MFVFLSQLKLGHESDLETTQVRLLQELGKQADGFSQPFSIHFSLTQHGPTTQCGEDTNAAPGEAHTLETGKRTDLTCIPHHAFRGLAMHRSFFRRKSAACFEATFDELRGNSVQKCRRPYN